jgi:hypothetical protein
MSGSSKSKSGTENVWRVEHYQRTGPVTGETYPLPIFTDGRCRVTTNTLGPFADRFTYEETWAGRKIEFASSAGPVDSDDSNTYQVSLSRALEKHPEFWTDTPRDADLLRHLMSNIRQALSLLRRGPQRIQE